MYKTYNYKILLVMVMAVVAAVAIVFWQQNTDDSVNDRPLLSGLPIKVADSFWPGVYWLTIAQKKGWFTEAGLNVELVDTNLDYFGSLQDTVDGKLDSNGFSLFDLIKFRLEGHDLVGVLYSDDSRGVDAIAARSEITSLKGLKGKRVGVDPGNYLEYILDEALRRDGIRPSDVIKVPILTEEAAEILAAGQVDAIVAWEPIVSQALALKGIHKLFDTSQIPGISPALMVFSRRFIDARPSDVQAFITVWQRTNDYIRDHLDEAFAIVAEARNVSVDEVRQLAQVDIIMNLRDNLNAFSEGSGIASLHGRARRINNFFINKGLMKQHLNTLDLLDDQFVRALSFVTVNKRQ